MENEGEQFQKIVDSLASLTEGELLHLEELVWKRQFDERNQDTSPRGNFRSANVVFSKQKISEKVLSAEEIEKALAVCNPAEIKALHTLIMFHLDKTHDHEGQSIQASWNNTGGFRRAGEIIGFNRKPDTATSDPEVARKISESFSRLLREAEAAKEAGNREQAQVLVEEAIQLAEKFGLPSTMLQRLRDQYS